MNRLQLELRRLYGAAPAGAGGNTALNLIDAANRVRALVFELTRPASWEVLGKLWQGVQTELELPAPAIAVSGVDGLQLWFSLAEPVPAHRAHEFLVALGGRFLPDVARDRCRLWPAEERAPAAEVWQPPPAAEVRPPPPAADEQGGKAAVVQERPQVDDHPRPTLDRNEPFGTAASAHGAPVSRHELHARWVPSEQGASGNWSAFVAPDLAPVFADTPWLDISPSEEGQTNLLRGLRSIHPAEFEAAWQRVAPPANRPPAAAKGSAGDDPLSAPLTTPTAMPPRTLAPTLAETSDQTSNTDPRRFLQQVMNDAAVPLALRIEAAKALMLR